MPAIPKTDQSTVVLLGFWNPAILTPPWLSKYAFERDDEQVPVEMELSSVAGLPPRFKMFGLKIVPAGDRLLIVPEGIEETQLDFCEQSVRRILLALTHTPISACGVNFAFEDEEPSDRLQDLFRDEEGLAERTGLDFQTTSMARTRSMEMNGYVLNFTRTLVQGIVEYKFNFHYSVTNAQAASELFSGVLNQNLQVARKVVAAYDTL